MLETLYHKDHHGNLRQWRVWTSQDTIHTEYGLVGGALLTSAKKATPKNEGKANETTAITQALAEAKSMWQKRLDRKYSLTPEEAEMPILQPMLAKSFDEKKFKPGFIQRKIDGSRALGFWENGKIKLLSRGNKEWTVPKHINDQLSRILDKDSVVDGELFLPDVPFEKVMSAIKKYSPITDQVQYIIYDMPVVKGVDDLPFSERLVHMNNLPLTNNLVLCETYFVNTVEEVLDCEKKFVEEKFEGAILRDPDGLYQFGYRSGSILKIKTFEDAEFKVLDVRPGIGSFVDCAVFVCQNDINDLTFDCIMATTTENKQEQLLNKEKYIGKMLCVKFFGRTKNGLGRFPVGKGFRPDEDMDNKETINK